ncbi:hypothetical protein [Collimonas pratensis]|uniref:Transmembrane protein n=1 Tax=Collimonas pratensis TaxID=279113 RepID=A0A127Q9U8_9BURK|nr:hypothetical protein [Collimonas pratensis]AMP06808.1 hypothetical protein CPter91_4501 [Collimonas pratensis]
MPGKEYPSNSRSRDARPLSAISTQNTTFPLIPKDRNTLQWKQCIAWLVGSLAMPFAADPFVREAAPDIGFDFPVILVFGIAWAAASFFLHRFIKSNLR